MTSSDSSLTRARIAGALLLVIAFGLGIVGGLWLSRVQEPGLDIRITATDRMPRELERLDLSDAQRQRVHEALVRGRDRVLRVTDSFQGPMEAAVDSTDQEIRAILTDSQRASFDSARRANGPPLQRKRVIMQK